MSTFEFILEPAPISHGLYHEPTPAPTSLRRPLAEALYWLYPSSRVAEIAAAASQYPESHPNQTDLRTGEFSVVNTVSWVMEAEGGEKENGHRLPWELAVTVSNHLLQGVHEAVAEQDEDVVEDYRSVVRGRLIEQDLADDDEESSPSISSRKGSCPKGFDWSGGEDSPEPEPRRQELPHRAPSSKSSRSQLLYWSSSMATASARPSAAFKALESRPVLNTGNFQVDDIYSHLPEQAHATHDSLDSGWDFSGTPIMFEEGDLEDLKPRASVRPCKGRVSDTLQKLFDEPNAQGPFITLGTDYEPFFKLHGDLYCVQTFRTLAGEWEAVAKELRRADELQWKNLVGLVDFAYGQAETYARMGNVLSAWELIGAEVTGALLFALKWEEKPWSPSERSDGAVVFV
ncbi:hypothetical protein RQP46_004302 [Phenoliferia psychrophenolica]